MFNGVKLALITTDSRILTYLRDDKPSLYMANRWDLPGGGREGNETPFQTIQREVLEEFGICLAPEQIIYEADYESERFPGQRAKFMVGKITDEQINQIDFGSEGQKYKIIPIQDYLNLENAVAFLQDRLRAYLKQI